MRLKSRHILLRIVYDNNTPDLFLALPQLAKAISNQIESNFGDYGGMVVKFAYQLKYFNAVTGLAILRVPRDNNQLVIYAISCVKALAGKPCKIDVLHISGTIKKCQLIAIEVSREHLKELALRQFLTPSEVDGDSQSDSSSAKSTVTEETPQEAIVLTSDGDIVIDPNTIAQIGAIENDILNIDSKPM